MNTTLDEWEILDAVVQLGGFAPAAKHLNRSQSTISYAIARLQDQLGVKLFDLRGRKAQLTEVGRILLADAEPLLTGFRSLEQRARSLGSGGESEIRISVDSIFPTERLFAALSEFTQRFPHTNPKIKQATFLFPDVELSVHGAHLCITAFRSQEYFVKPSLEIRMLAVARYDHPLNQLRRQASRTDLVQHMIVVIEGMTPTGPKRQPYNHAQRFLPVNTIGAAVDAVRSGLCFGWLPIYLIQPQLDSGELVAITMPVGGMRDVRLNIVCKELSSSSTELNALANLLGADNKLEVI